MSGDRQAVERKLQFTNDSAFRFRFHLNTSNRSSLSDISRQCPDQELNREERNQSKLRSNRSLSIAKLTEKYRTVVANKLHLRITGVRYRVGIHIAHKILKNFSRMRHILRDFILLWVMAMTVIHRWRRLQRKKPSTPSTTRISFGHLWEAFWRFFRRASNDLQQATTKRLIRDAVCVVRKAEHIVISYSFAQRRSVRGASRLSVSRRSVVVQRRRLSRRWYRALGHC